MVSPAPILADGLKPSELNQLIADLEPISVALNAAGSR